MKNKILLASVAFIGLATTTGVSGALLVTDPVAIARVTTVSTIFLLGSVGLFFVGLVFPKETQAVKTKKTT